MMEGPDGGSPLTRVEKITNEVKMLFAEEREEFIRKLKSMMCLECGSLNPSCHCWNDE